MFLAGIGYYFFIYLKEKKEEVKKAINELFQQNSAITTADLDAGLWKNKENWEEHLDSLYLGSQINLFMWKMKNSIEEKQKETEKQTKEKKKQAREKAIEEIEKICNDTFGDMREDLPSVQKAMKTFTKKVTDSYSKSQKNKKRKIEIKGKSIEQAREENKKSQIEIDEWKKKYEDNEGKIKSHNMKMKSIDLGIITKVFLIE